MTTIKDMLLAALRDIGADGVAGTYDTMTLDEIAATDIDGRPAFLDADGRLVPLPDDWMVRDGLLRHPSGLMIYNSDAGFVAVRNGYIGRYPTAPEAWAAAEAWLKEQGR